MIGDAVKARWVDEKMAGASGGGGTVETERKLELLHRQCKLAIEAGIHESIARTERMIRLLEAKEAREMEVDCGGVIR
jgi:hypothetical protein